MKTSNSQLATSPRLCCIDMDVQLINYVLKPIHILLILDRKIWLGFNYVNPFSKCNHEDYSNEQLHLYFIGHILPNINKYELQEEQQHILKVLDIHPNFRRGEFGYQFVNIADKIRGKSDKLVPELHFTYKLGSVTINKINEFYLKTHKRKHNVECHSVALESGRTYADLQQPVPKIVSAESHILLSAMLSSEYELSQFQLLSLADIRKRMSEAKYNFSNKCILAENVKLTSAELTEKLKCMHMLRLAIMDLYQKYNFTVLYE